MKSSTPVTLFIVECTATNLFRKAYPDIMLMIFTKAIAAVHIYSHIGISITVRIFIRQTAAKMKSATESNLDPNSLTVSVFRAMIPSAMSDNPAIRYSIKKSEENDGLYKSPILTRTLKPVITFAIISLHP